MSGQPGVLHPDLIPDKWPFLYTVDDLLRPDDEPHNEQVREAYARGVVATAQATSEGV